MYHQFSSRLYTIMYYQAHNLQQALPFSPINPPISVDASLPSFTSTFTSLCPVTQFQFVTMGIEAYGVWRAKPIRYTFENRSIDPHTPHLSLYFKDNKGGDG